MASGVNPFRYTAPVRSAELVDRLDERQVLIDLAWSSNNSRLVAPRRYGKTSLLQAVLDQADREGWAAVYVDFFGVLSREDVAARIEAAYSTALTGRLAQWFASARRSLHPLARLGGGAAPAAVELSLSSSPDDPLVQRLNLPLRINERDGRRVLVAFDEFQDVLGAGSADAEIRAQIQHHGDAASYIFAGSHIGMMEELFADRRRAFYAQAQPVSLGPLDPVSLGEHIGGHFEATGKRIGVSLGPLLDAAAGHPQRAMMLAHHVWDGTADGGTAGEEVWDGAYRRALADVADEAKTIWSRLSATERQVLATVAENVVGLYSRSGRTPRGGATASAIAALAAGGEVIRDPARVSGYRVVDPLLAAWLRAGRTLAPEQ